MQEHKLLRLLQKKKGLCEAILELTEMEGTLSMSEWISVLRQKKVLLSSIEEIDTELSPFQESLFSLSQDITEELEEIRHVIQRILHLDSCNVEKRRKNLKGEHPLS